MLFGFDGKCVSLGVNICADLADICECCEVSGGYLDVAVIVKRQTQNKE